MANEEPETVGAGQQLSAAAAKHLVVTPEFEAPDESVYVHKDLVRVVEPWTVEQHVGPVNTIERFGDIDSFAAYVKRYAGDVDNGGGEETFITWNSQRLRAVLDYHTSSPGRCQWVAEYTFEQTPEWAAWLKLHNGGAISQKAAVEALEERFEEIQDPDAATLMNLLRALRTNVNTDASAQMNEDGTTELAFAKKSSVGAGPGGTAKLPHEIQIAVPLIKGHRWADGDDAGKLAVFRLSVHLRAVVEDNAQLKLRFTIQAVEHAIDQACEDLVKQAKAALGEQLQLFRAAG